MWPLLQSKQDCQEVSKVRLYIDVAWRGPQAYLRWEFVRFWVGLSRRPLHIRFICVGKCSPSLKENKYNAGKRCQVLANAVKHSQTLGNVRKSWIAPDIKRSKWEWKISFSRTSFRRRFGSFIILFKRWPTLEQTFIVWTHLKVERTQDFKPRFLEKHKLIKNDFLNCIGMVRVLTELTFVSKKVTS